MKCILMNKNTPILLLEYNTKYNTIEKIYDIYNIEYAPLSVYNANKNISKNLVAEVNKWFRNRGIPSWRKNIEKLLENLNVSTTEELLNKAYALSLSDQYWIKEQDSQIEWKDINFFENDFKYKAYLDISLSNSSDKRLNQAELKSPNNTTDGMLQKGWIIENGKRVLVKGIYQPSREEPINEWLASEICRRLDFYHCDYSIDIINNRIVSKCESFVTSDEENISAYDIYNSEKKSNNVTDLEHYINILEKHNVPDARKNVENMFVLDFIIMNIDRHMKNFGVIRNVNTLEWVRTTPIFDNGESMQCDKLTSEINFTDGKGKFFTNTDKKYSEMLKKLETIREVDIKKLEGIVTDYKNVLEKYQPYTDATSERIRKLCFGLEKRIKKLYEKE